MCMYPHITTLPNCTYRHYPGILESPWHHPSIISVSPLHHPGIPETAHDCIMSLTSENVLKAERLAAGLGCCELLVLMSFSASLLPCLTPTSDICALAVQKEGSIAEEASCSFDWQVCNERDVMTLHIHQMVVFSLDLSVMFGGGFFFPPSAQLGLLREKWHVGTYVLVHTTLV